VLQVLVWIVGAFFYLWLPVAAAEGGPSAPGLRLEFEATGPAGGAVVGSRKDARRSRLLALRCPEGQAPTPFLRPGPFRARWDGALEIEFFDEFHFFAEGTGAFKLEIGGQTLLETEDLAAHPVRSELVELEGGKAKLVAYYQSPPSGAAILHVGWSGFDFPQGEPLPPAVLSHSPEDAFLRERLEVRSGRELFATLRCFRCHTSEKPLGEDSATNPRQGAMPELAMDAPSFEGIGARLREGWMAQWIADPRAHRSNATMPKIFGATAKGSTSSDEALRSVHVASYLATQVGATGGARTPSSTALSSTALSSTALSSTALASDGLSLTAADARRGEALFASLGCVACHLNDPSTAADGGDTYGRFSLAHVARKWRGPALVEFLKEPERHYAWIRMPNFHLSDAEANGLAAFLLQGAHVTPRETERGSPKGNPEKGKALVQSSGCLSCHTLELENCSLAPSLESIAEGLASIAKGLESTAKGNGQSGCLAPETSRLGRAPDFSLEPAQRAALAAFLAAEVKALKTRSLEEFSERQFSALRCFGCHSRDGAADVWSNVEGTVASTAGVDSLVGSPGGTDEAEEATTILEIRPNLTWIGEKLRPEWMAKFLSGEITTPVRPWFRSRMPKFATRAKLLAHGFSLQHGLPERASPADSPDLEQAKVGRRLIDRDRFQCVTCHDVGEVKAVGVFDAHGTNFDVVTQRLRKPFFHRWMLNPTRVSPDTKMPTFAAEGRSPFEEFGGDVVKQFEAIWNYFLEIARARSSE